MIYKLALEGKGNVQIANILEDRQILTPSAYWVNKGVKKPYRAISAYPYGWNGSTVGKILKTQEYCGDIINFKTYSKSFKLKKRFPTPKEAWKIYEGVFEPIIDRETWLLTQEYIDRTKRRKMKDTKSEKNPFADLLSLAVRFLSLFPASLPQPFHRCLPSLPLSLVRFSSGLFHFLLAFFRPLTFRFQLLSLLLFLSTSSRSCLAVAFPVHRLGSRLLGSLFISGLVSRAFLPDSCTQLYCWFPFALP